MRLRRRRMPLDVVRARVCVYKSPIQRIDRGWGGACPSALAAGGVCVGAHSDREGLRGECRAAGLGSLGVAHERSQGTDRRRGHLVPLPQRLDITVDVKDLGRAPQPQVLLLHASARVSVSLSFSLSLSLCVRAWVDGPALARARVHAP
jgi:hypothetical protein